MTPDSPSASRPFAPDGRGDVAPSEPATSTLFASTGLHGASPPSHTPQPAATLDVCHVGVVLRTLLAVHAAVALGVAFASTSWSQAAFDLLLALSVSVPAVLLWLVCACALRRPADR
ncbi:MAG: hypothetical protein MK041_13035, partial [Aquabacterium sp.]|nr:hypothetical protein [Aquabacterium sp.]